MIKLIKIEIKPFNRKIANLIVKYHDLSLYCELWIYRDIAMFVKMPELKLELSSIRLVGWDSKEVSDFFQKDIIEQVFEKSGLTLEKCVELSKESWEKNQKNAQVRKANIINKQNQELKKMQPKPVSEKPKTKFVPMSFKGFTEIILEKDDEFSRRIKRISN